MEQGIGGCLKSAPAMVEGRFRQFVRQAAHVGGEIVLEVVSAAFVIWATSKAAESDQRPPVIAEFNGHEATFTTPFATTGPWHISWQGDLDIQVWINRLDEAPLQYGQVSGYNGSAFFSDAGTFFFVIVLLQAGSWSITVRSR